MPKIGKRQRRPRSRRRKPRAFETFEAKAREAADFLRARGVAPEIRKDVAVGYETKLKVYTHLMRRGPEERARLKALMAGEGIASEAEDGPSGQEAA